MSQVQPLHLQFCVHIRSGVQRVACIAAITLAVATEVQAQNFPMDNQPETVCSGTFTDSGGVGGAYAPGELLLKTFTPGGTSTKLRVDFTFFSLDSITPGCGFGDWLRIYDGPSNSDPLIGEYCDNTGSPGTITSTHPSGALTFWFKSQLWEEGEGWIATLSCVGGTHNMDDAPVTTCTATTFYDSGGSSSGYSNSEDFTKTFFPLPGNRIRANFTQFDLEIQNGGLVCLVDYIGIFDGPGPGASLVGTYCPALTGPPGTVISTHPTGALTFRFHSDSTIVDLGWKAIIDCLPWSTPPANDSCSNPHVTGIGLHLTDLTHATPDTSDGFNLCNCFANGTVNRWYEFTAPWDGLFTADTFGTNAKYGSDTTLALRSSCNPGTEIVCNDNALGLDSKVSYLINAGETVLIDLGARCASSASTLVDLRIDLVPENDDCADAIDVSITGTFAGLLNGSSHDESSSCDFVETRDVWHVYTATASGELTVNTCGTRNQFGMNLGPNSDLAVFDGCGGNELACNSDHLGLCSTPGTASSVDAEVVVVVSTGDTVLIRVSVANFDSLGPYLLNVSFEESILDFCSGDGGDQMGCTDCPCMNNATPGTTGGCLNSVGASARLEATGDPSVSLPSGDTADLRFALSGVPGNAFCILNSGDGLAPSNMANPCFGLNTGGQAAAFDGLRCAIGNTRRHGGRSADVSGDVGLTNSPWGGEGGPPVGIAVAGGGFVAGQTRYFQVINRDDPNVSCGRGLNTSQAIEITFTP